MQAPVNLETFVPPPVEASPDDIDVMIVNSFTPALKSKHPFMFDEYVSSGDATPPMVVFSTRDIAPPYPPSLPIDAQAVDSLSIFATTQSAPVAVPISPAPSKWEVTVDQAVEEDEDVPYSPSVFVGGSGARGFAFKPPKEKPRKIICECGATGECDGEEEEEAAVAAACIQVEPLADLPVDQKIYAEIATMEVEKTEEQKQGTSIFPTCSWLKRPVTYGDVIIVGVLYVIASKIFG